MIDGLTKFFEALTQLVVALSIPGLLAFFSKEYYWPQILKWRKLRENIIYTLTKDANVIGREDTMLGGIINRTEVDELCQTLRGYAAEVSSIMWVRLVGHDLLVKLRLLPSNEMAEDLRGYLIGWSNSIFSDRERDHLIRNMENVKRLMGMPHFEDIPR